MPKKSAKKTVAEPVVDELLGSTPGGELVEPVASPGSIVEVWERRFLNPGGRSSTPINLTAPNMTTRWINTAIEGRHHRAIYDQGWQPVPTKLLADPASIPDLFKRPDKVVARGERGKEVLMMMPTHVFKRIQARKAELNTKALKNIRSEIAQAAGSKFGADAGEFVATGQTADGHIKTVGSVQFGHERIPMGSND